MSEEVARVSKPCPGGCGRTVAIEFETDGFGHVVEVAELCSACRPSSILVVPEGSTTRVCRQCERSWVEPKKRGRPQTRCPDCRVAWPEGTMLGHVMLAELIDLKRGDELVLSNPDNGFAIVLQRAPKIDVPTYRVVIRQLT